MLPNMHFVCSAPVLQLAWWDKPGTARLLEEPYLTFTPEEKAAPGNRDTTAAGSQLCVLLSRPAWFALLQIPQLTAGGVQPL